MKVPFMAFNAVNGTFMARGSGLVTCRQHFAHQ